MQSSQLQRFSSKQNTAKLNPFNAGSHKREGSRRAEEGKVPEDIYKVKKISEHTSPCGSVCSAAGKSSGGFVCFFLVFFALLISAPARVVALACVVQKTQLPPGSPGPPTVRLSAGSSSTHSVLRLNGLRRTFHLHAGHRGHEASLEQSLRICGLVIAVQLPAEMFPKPLWARCSVQSQMIRVLVGIFL